MIKTEQLTIGNKTFTRTYSDANRYVVRDGVSYDEALDPSEFGRTYTEGDIIPLEPLSDDEYAEAGRILMGVSE